MLQRSRFNVGSVNITLEFFKALVNSNFLLPTEIRILMFYNVQRQRCINAMGDLEKELRIARGQLAQIVVHTSDSF